MKQPTSHLMKVVDSKSTGSISVSCTDIVDKLERSTVRM